MILFIFVSLELVLISHMTERLRSAPSLSETDRSSAKAGMGRLLVCLILTRTDAGTTYPWVIHSEANALMKLAKNGGGSNGATIYCTHSPCMDCALLILQAGITRIVYDEVYCKDSIKFLKERGIKLECINGTEELHTRQDRLGSS